MNEKIQRFLESLAPFTVIGVAIAICMGLLYLFSYFLIWGLMIGVILWLIALAKDYFLPEEPKKQKKGRIIEHDGRK